MPRLDAADLCAALRRLTRDEFEEVLLTRLIPATVLPDLRLFIACGEQAVADAEVQGLQLAAFVSTADFMAAVRAVRGRRLLDLATFGLARRMPQLSANRRITLGQGVAALTLLAAAITLGLVLPAAASWCLASAFAGLFFLGVVALRILALLPGPARQPVIRRPAAEWQLPVYSVLVPLFRETAVLPQLIGALSAIDYPRQRLDIKLLLEEADIPMQRAVAAMRLPPHFEVIVVPAGQPQTKPRALNYGLQFARGELLTIYDAEDIPDPWQLREAAGRFAASSPGLACLQAELAFYNPDESWMTRQFTIEYAVLFTLLLPALAEMRLPLPLGGTSNHFRVAALKQAGAWDAFNVTEDADLGIRLARLGYDITTLESRTLEEANTRFLNWQKQRARWLKGFLLTWFVHMRHPIALWRELGTAGFWTMQALTIGVFMSALLHPFCLATAAILYMTHPLAGPDAGPAVKLIAALNLCVFVAGYAVSFAAAAKALRKRGTTGWFLTLASMPLYWLMMSAAAWYGLWQFVISPFHWNKTEHGLSRQRKLAEHGRRDL